MPFDLNVLVLDQKEKTPINWKSPIVVLNEIDHKETISRYHSIWPFMVAQKGIWYSLVTPDLEFKGFYLGSEICSVVDELDPNYVQIPFWIEDQDIKDQLNPIKIHDNHLDEFQKIITFLTNNSPIKKSIFMARFQSTDHEIINGVLPLEIFIKNIKEGKILFNVGYIVQS